MHQCNGTFWQFTCLSSLFLLALSAAVHTTRLSAVGFVLTALPVVALGMDATRVCALYLAGTILFFEPSLPTSHVSFLGIPDAVFLVYLPLLIVAPNGLTWVRWSVPRNLWPLYLFCGYAVAMSIVPLVTERPVFGFWFDDVKSIVHLLLAVIFVGSEALAPRNLSRLLLLVVYSSVGLALVCVVTFALTGARVIIWNDVYLGLAIVAALSATKVLPPTPLRPVLTAATQACLVLGLLVTQSRGMWLATILAVLVWFLMGVRRASLRRSVGRAVAWGLIVVLCLTVASKFWGLDVAGFVERRSTEFAADELVNPSASLGYRLYESYRVWQERTWLGHGSGATIRLYNPFIGARTEVDWWCIHSEYFEILHKYGFVGLGLFCGALLSALLLALRMSRESCSFRRELGRFVLCSLVLLLFVSITSGFIIRVNTSFYIMLLLSVLGRYARPAARRALVPGSQGGRLKAERRPA